VKSVGKFFITGNGWHAGHPGENITTHGINILGLPTNICLFIGDTAVIRVTGLRNPCVQIDQFQPGLLSKVVSRDEHGGLIRKAIFYWLSPIHSQMM
jgi:MOSC domain-containing protein YiiM